MSKWPAIVLGGSGYVAGEMLRLVATHPSLELAAAVSTSAHGEPIADTFGHLRSAYPDESFTDVATAERLLEGDPPLDAQAGQGRDSFRRIDRDLWLTVDGTAGKRSNDRGLREHLGAWLTFFELILPRTEQ